MASSTFAIGIVVRYKDIYGEIAFICEQYLTICVLKRDANMVSDVCMVVYRENWEDIELLKSSHK